MLWTYICLSSIWKHWRNIVCPPWYYTEHIFFWKLCWVFIHTSPCVCAHQWVWGGKMSFVPKPFSSTTMGSKEKAQIIHTEGQELVITEPLVLSWAAFLIKKTILPLLTDKGYSSVNIVITSTVIAFLFTRLLWGF